MIRANPLRPSDATVGRRDFLGAIGGVAAVSLLGCQPPPATTLAGPTTGRERAVDIDHARQLFVDDHVIERTTLARVFHQPHYAGDAPVLRPDRPWEEAGQPTACAMPFSDGVMYDPGDRLYKLWYMAGLGKRQTCLATSVDGHQWHKPALDIVAGTNIVWPWHTAHGRDSHTVVRDPFDSQWPFKMGSSSSGRSGESDYWLLGSPDGVHWTQLGETPTRVGDRTTLFFDPFRRRWVFSIRQGGEVQAPPRHRVMVASESFVPRDWQPRYWVGADKADPFEAGANGTPPQLYNLDCAAYEGLLVGLFTIFRGDVHERPKLNDVCVGFSRDGATWVRPDRRPFIGLGQRGAWNYGNVQSTGGCFVVMGDTLGFYVSGRAGVPGTADSGESSTGLALLRRDGFCAMEGTGSLTTRPLVYSGQHLWVNAVVDGELRVEILDVDQRVLLPASQCVPIRGDSTRHQVRFAPDIDLATGRGRPLRLRFRSERARLFSFWVSADTSGRSGGYLAAGGPDANAQGRDLAS